MKISNEKRINKNTLVGVFDLELPSGLKINGCMLFDKNGRKWISFPSKEWTKADGTKSYFPLIEFSTKEIADKFQAAVLPVAEAALR